ncbi:hypothetical protein L798_14851 [Zootermopsis nevadensis]|uniref:Uncharacterized protein n=1 Tax=Zootermopsis nevadensis TaxID=136037 RepID=A0A067QNK8_ZOONE|nr:hypothetical protein L798_14851 [Zootermopsis nevadensis]
MAFAMLDSNVVAVTIAGTWHTTSKHQVVLLLGMPPKKFSDGLTRKWAIYSGWFFRRTLTNTDIPDCIAAIIVR